MNESSNARPGPTDGPGSMRRLVAWVFWGLWLRVAAADLVQWYCRRKGVLCVFPDTATYWELAGKIRLGEPFEVTYFADLPHFALRTPGYPVFLAVCQCLFGVRAMPVRLAQATLGAACVGLVASLTRKALPSKGTLPLIAAAIAAVDPFVVANSAFLLSEALFLPLMLAAQVGFAVLWEPKGETRLSPGQTLGWGLLTGAVSGSAVLVRPSWALFVPIMLAVWFLLRGRKAIGRGVIVLLGLIAVMMPWWVRNDRIYGRFVPTALWMGASLYDGLSPRADGRSDMTFLGDPDLWPLDEETQDLVLRRRAWSFARQNPGRVLVLAVAKAGRFWSPWPNAEGFRSPLVMIVSSLVTLPQFALLALGLWDRHRARDHRALVLLALPLLYTFLLHLIFVSSMRYRVPVMVPALGLMALGWGWLEKRWKRDGEKKDQ